MASSPFGIPPYPAQVARALRCVACRGLALASALCVSTSIVDAQVPTGQVLEVRRAPDAAPAAGFSGKLRALLVPIAPAAPVGAVAGGESMGSRAERGMLSPVKAVLARLRGGVGDSVEGSGGDPRDEEVRLVAEAEAEDLVPIPVLPFGIKHRGRIGTYELGQWPAERRSARSAAYEVPAGFIEVHRAQASQPISEHFTLGDFLTRDQAAVWPKYLVLRAPLIDKLELVLAALRDGGYEAQKLSVLSGFRTPRHNGRVISRGAAAESRHQYGDAADVFVDNGDGRMADLNQDGRRDIEDARTLAAAVEAVDAAYPSLVGGIGIYPALGPHGAFVHIDVRGEHARWEGRTPTVKAKRSRWRRGNVSRRSKAKPARARSAVRLTAAAKTKASSTAKRRAAKKGSGNATATKAKATKAKATKAKATKAKASVSGATGKRGQKKAGRR